MRAPGRHSSHVAREVAIRGVDSPDSNRPYRSDRLADRVPKMSRAARNPKEPDSPVRCWWTLTGPYRHQDCNGTARARTSRRQEPPQSLGVDWEGRVSWRSGNGSHDFGSFLESDRPVARPGAHEAREPERVRTDRPLTTNVEASQDIGGPDAADLAAASLAMARRFTVGAKLWCSAPSWPWHAEHAAAEFAHPKIAGERSLPAVMVPGDHLWEFLRPIACR